MDLSGRLISDRYRIERLVARGGMATVYAAIDTRLDRRIALKVIHPHLAADESFQKKFVREAKIAAALSHPNLVNVFDQAVDGEIVYLVMEYVAGITLREALNDFKKLDAKRALEIFEPVMAGLAAAHGAGILHRDIKPENVLLADDGKIKLSDFGLARPIAAQTQTGGVVGTVAYLSPELVSRGTADARSDIYASGVMLFELLAGRQPFQGEQAVQIAMQHANSNVPAPSTVDASIPALMDELVLWATAKNPTDRPADAVEFHSVVQRARNDLARGQAQELTEVLKNTNLANQRTIRLAETTSATEKLDLGSAAGTATTRLDLEHEPNHEFIGASRYRALKILIASVLAVVLGLGAGWYFSAGPGGFGVMPKVVGLSEAAAQTALNSAKAKIVIVRESSKNVAAGEVMSSDPAAGSLLFGGTVTLHISTGPKLVNAPALMGKTLVEASALILQAGFSVGKVDSWFNTAAIGTVYAYNGSDGSQIAEGSAIDLEISLGAIPVVAGMSQATATNVLQVAGLTVKTVVEQYSDTAAKGTVISLVPLSEPLGKSGDVKLVISKGSNLVLMPNVVGQTIAAAQSYLMSLGLVVVVDTNQLTSKWGIAKVKKISPAAGTRLRIGDTVTIISR